MRPSNMFATDKPTAEDGNSSHHCTAYHIYRIPTFFFFLKQKQLTVPAAILTVCMPMWEHLAHRMARARQFRWGTGVHLFPSAARQHSLTVPLFSAISLISLTYKYKYGVFHLPPKAEFRARGRTFELKMFHFQVRKARWTRLLFSLALLARTQLST